MLEAAAFVGPAMEDVERESVLVDALSNTLVSVVVCSSAVMIVV
jgi:hypothetical protein